jgi:pimeloyl-ACP methyl ester carboxylesterase
MKAGRALKRTFSLVGVLVLLAVLAAALVLWRMAAHAKVLQRDDPGLAAPSTGTFVDAFDTRIFVQRTGDPHAPAIVFVHGTGSWSEAWRACMDHVAGLGYQAVALDLPPFGYSIAPGSGDYSKATQGRRILAALDSIGVKQATFVAHSFGAAPVMEALLREPQRASSLVLVDAALGLDAVQTDGRPNALQSLLGSTWLAENISAALLTNPAMTQTLLRGFISEKEKATAQWIRLYQQPLAVSGTYRKVAQWLPQLVAGRAHAASDQIEPYKRLPFAVTLIWGEADTITPLGQAQHLQAILPRSSLIVIPKAGHIPQIEEPALFREALTRAIASTPAP